MIIDARELPNGQPLQADICIIGAGAAGIAVSLALIDSGLEILLIESGGLSEEADTQALYAGTVTDERLHSPPDKYRQRRFGGTTTIWGGRCMPFDPIDFQPRDYIGSSGWPISRDELLPYYERANRLCEAGEFIYTAEESFSRPLRPMIAGFQSNHFTHNTLERFSCPTDFGARYGHQLRTAKNLRVILRANVTSINLQKNGEAVQSLSIATLAKQQYQLQASQFVIASGGIETVRLLLASRDVHQNGIGNQHDVVGRYYMCHIAGTIGTIKINRPLGDVWHGYDISDEGIYCRRRLALREDAQRKHRIGNFIARLHHPRITNPEHRNAILSSLYLAKALIPYEYGKRLHGEESASFATYLKHVRNVAMGPFDTFAFAWHMLRDRKLAERKFPSIIIKSKANLFSLDFHAEQEPNPNSRITLTNQCDALGVPQVNIDWRYTRGDIQTCHAALQLLADDIKSSGIGAFEYDPADVEAEMIRYGAYGGHHIGTARMGIDPKSSVVDTNCRVHGIANLFIASAAVFPTSSQANPTLTVVAIAQRLAAHLRANKAVP
jgi:choline dehydrogenase-like flavoprotein